MHCVPTVTLGKGTAAPLQIPRIVTGLWQLAGGHDEQVDVQSCAHVMSAYVKKGLTAFDMADRESQVGKGNTDQADYGPAEEVIGVHRSQGGKGMTAFTKWCPQPGPSTPEVVREAQELASQRMGGGPISLLQYHAWRYEDRTYLSNLFFLQQLRQEGRIQHLGLTNTDLAHLKVLHDSGITIASNQVSISVLDRRAEKGGMLDWCQQHNVGILAYGVLLGGFLSEKWLDKEEPKQLDNWSLKKYKRFIDAAGGWIAFQRVLRVLADTAKKHSVSISTVAIRHVLDSPGVSAVIIGSRLNESSARYIDSTLQAFSLNLDDEDRARLVKAQEGLSDVPGDCGDEYRRPPYLTAKGDLGDHLSEDQTRLQKLVTAVKEGKRIEFSSGSKWEPLAGYCRAVRIGDTVHVSGTTAAYLPDGSVVGGQSPASQSVQCFDIIQQALAALGGDMRDVVRTRIFLRDESDCEEVVKVHGKVFGREGIRPCNTTFGGARLIGTELLVEIEAEAILGSSGLVRLP